MNLIRKAVLENLKIEKNGISIEELPFVGKLNLRGNPKDKDFLSNVDSILKIAELKLVKKGCYAKHGHNMEKIWP